jgi:hypothetical protein
VSLGLELFLTGSMRNDGLIADEDVSGVISINGSVDLGVSGEVRLSTSLAGSPVPNQPAADSYQLTNGPGHTITAIQMGPTGSGLLVSNLGVVNRGTMRTDTADLLLDPAQGASRPNAFLNQGLLQADGRTVEVRSGIFRNDGRVEAIDGGDVVFAPGVTNASRFGSTLVGGTWLVDASATPGSSIALGGAPILTNLADVTLRGASASFPEILGLAENRGALRLDDFALQRSGPFSNSGELELRGTGRLDVSGSYTQSGGVLRLAGGTLAAASVDFTGGAISGSGVVQGSVSAAGRIDPGEDLLAFDGDLVLQPDATLWIDLTGDLAGLQLEGMAVFGDVSFENGSSVLLSWNGPGAGPAPGSTLDLVSADSIAADLEQIAFELAQGAFDFTTSIAAITGGRQALRVEVTALGSALLGNSVPEPGALLLLLAPLAVLLGSRARR